MYRLVLATALLVATPAFAADLTLDVTEIRDATGTLNVALVDADGYAGKARPLRGEALPVTGATHQLVFKGLPAGRYAVMITHDANGNGRLDTNALGMPLEGYGFSNNPRVMRKPTFEEAAFDVGEADATLAVELR